MGIKQKTLFEIFDAGYILKIEPQAYSYTDADNDWDRNWLETSITVKGGKFTGIYNAKFMTTEFRSLRNGFASLGENYSGSLDFSNRDGYIELKVKGDGLGHFDIKVIARDEPNYGGELAFDMAFDQTSLSDFIHQLDNIMSTYPVVGDI